MAIVKSADGSTIRKVIGGNLITVGSTGSQVMQDSTNNRARGSSSRARQTMPGSTVPGSEPQIPSPGFTAMDGQVTWLDAQFELLADKSPWAIYAANIDGNWQLCANCMPDSGAKKLYRQYNFNRSLLGLPLVSVPLDNTEFQEEFVTDMTYVSIPSSGIFEVQFDRSAGAPAVGFSAKIGAGSANPAGLLPTGSTFRTSDPNNPLAKVATAIVAFLNPPIGGGSFFQTFTWCFFTADGAPGLSSSVDVEINRSP